ncbi:MAG: mechanosensitive ion channel family protein, partial [Candidatus Cloacimonetes bacterium]|nr:mechanosensitive ion channel family protein [Candidatus Cloacimonadota bacterium]
MPDSTFVNPSAWAGMVEKSLPFLTTIGLKLLAAILIYIVGKWVAKLIANTLRKVMTRSKMDASLVVFISNMAYAVILVFVVIAAIGKLGVQTTSFIAIIGAAG